MFNAFRDLQAFQEGVDGPFTGKLTAAQRTFLQGQIAIWETVQSDLVTAAARNGTVQGQLDAVKKGLTARQNTVEGMIGDVSNVDMAKAATALTQAQQAVQASSQVFLSLKNTSLLNFFQ
jgi:flagellar hook-associated protein 3 FlgL